MHNKNYHTLSKIPYLYNLWMVTTGKLIKASRLLDYNNLCIHYMKILLAQLKVINNTDYLFIYLK